ESQAPPPPVDWMENGATILPSYCKSGGRDQMRQRRAGRTARGGEANRGRTFPERGLLRRRGIVVPEAAARCGAGGKSEPAAEGREPRREKETLLEKLTLVNAAGCVREDQIPAKCEFVVTYSTFACTLR
ncbi:unnamed protein product, partial [Phaeothamnion confervicola]